MNGDNVWARLAGALIPGLPVLAYLTIDRPSSAFSVRGALLILLIGCVVIILAGPRSRTLVGANRIFVIIAALAVTGLGFAYALDDWWMAALASFTGLIAFVIARSSGNELLNDT
ncbi:MAG: hypothetical protein HKO03_10265 [Acidimicrobiia bacterium]|nr:hypothetical protein [Acidimicrobiia bacterium]